VIPLQVKTFSRSIYRSDRDHDTKLCVGGAFLRLLKEILVLNIDPPLKILRVFISSDIDVDIIKICINILLNILDTLNYSIL
jgi:hypothetical protein